VCDEDNREYAGKANDALIVTVIVIVVLIGEVVIAGVGAFKSKG